MTSAVVTRATKSVDVTRTVDDDGCLISSIHRRPKVLRVAKCFV